MAPGGDGTGRIGGADSADGTDGSGQLERVGETGSADGTGGSDGRGWVGGTGWVVRALRAGGCVFAEEEAAVVIEAAAGDRGELERLVGERVAGRPLEHLVGWAAFAGLRVVVGPGVFVPRRRTELLVRAAVRDAPDGAVVVDMCCGSGAIGAAIAAYGEGRIRLTTDADGDTVFVPADPGGPVDGNAGFESVTQGGPADGSVVPGGIDQGNPVHVGVELGAVGQSGSADAGAGVEAVDRGGAVDGGGGFEVWGADVEAGAVASARRNLGDGRVFEGDLFEALPAGLRGRVDVMVVNAPYVPSAAIATMPAEARVHEAPIALDGGGDGLDLQRRIVAGAAEWLAGGGRLLIETSEQQASLTAALFEAAGLHPRIERDESSDATVVVGHV
ncbi:putative protein N(5)-glutamine methyltransferase [Herbiconiux sp. VKM Ac-2851]|uniref:putative protein N(5)-glutamine methyltransferase n=1 Tax=Herbiconiux sp. VKM Ac-2851 TaxID=2739025 RepID=UPI00352E3E1A